MQSKTVAVRLSNEEINNIENFRKKYDVKSQNDFFRFSVGFTIGWMEIIIKLVTNEKLNSKVEQHRQNIQANLKNIPVENTNLQKMVNGYEKDILSEIDQEINKAVEQVKSFTQERSAGRPPQPKAGPGRPKEKEY